MNKCTGKTASYHQNPGQHLKQLIVLTSYFFYFSLWCRFVRRLLYFYKPSSKLYAGLALDHPKARQLTVVGCQFIEFLMESDEVREVCIYTTKTHFAFFFTFLSLSYLPCVSVFSLLSPSTGRPGVPGGPGEGHGVMAVLVLRAEARALSAE